MFHYFLQLPKLQDPERNKNVAYAVMKTAEDAFRPFYQYLDQAIKALKKKEEVRAYWEKIKEYNVVELQIIGSLFSIPKKTKIRLLNIEKGLYKVTNFDEIDEFDFQELLRYKVGKEKGKLQISEENFIEGGYIRLPFEFESFNNVSWGFESLELEPAWLSVNEYDEIIQEGKSFSITKVEGDELEVQGTLKTLPIEINGQEVDFEILDIPQFSAEFKIIRENEQEYIVYDQKSRKKHIPKLQNILNKENITFEDGRAFQGEHLEDMLFEVDEDLFIEGQRVVCDGIFFNITKIHRKNKNQYWIQLIEIDEELDDIPGFSPLKYFFDDDVTIEDEHRNKYFIAIGNESENKLVLRDKKKNYIFPKGEELRVKINTYQLQKQLEAILTLKNMPVKEHYHLIQLFEKRDKVRWEIPEPHFINNWFVLTDESRNGTNEQREFIEKALSTPDFAILEGPPGSGKTTVILELICQLARQGKRVLLCGSTHVAIDNVLERLKERDQNGNNLIEQFKILPVRIGDKQRIGEDVREFQLDNMLEQYNISEELLLDSANLVCGTVIGILQHPQLKKRTIKYNRKKPILEEPIVPNFDYLIIDESSKTTFQEFLVPGLYAKKWILAGDVMQLSPFTDREQVVSNLESLILSDGKSLPREYQDAMFYLQKLLKIVKYAKNKSAKNKFILPVSQPILKVLQKELQQRKNELNEIYMFYDPEHMNTLFLAASDVIFIDKNILEEHLSYLPETHAILRWERWGETEHAFLHNSWHKKNGPFKEEGNTEIEGSFKIVEEVNKYFKERSWAEEIAWRIDREHQLRLLDPSKTQHYKKVIEELLPRSINRKDIEERINNLAAIAFPSILESLIQGIKGRKTRYKTTISEGFRPEELVSRRTILKYQHRMHPDISTFPREQFYQTDALLDLEQPQSIEEMRQWSYFRYPKRSIWIDVKGETERNKNIKEVKRLIRELKAFIDFASQYEQPEGKEWSVACLTFYRAQERKIREELQKLTGRATAFSNFTISKNQRKIHIKLHTVDKFQGHEADIVFLSMVQTYRDGFMDNPNRLNVAITRAKFQLVIIGKREYFLNSSRSDDLKQLASHTQKWSS